MKQSLWFVDDNKLVVKQEISDLNKAVKAVCMLCSEMLKARPQKKCINIEFLNMKVCEGIKPYYKYYFSI